MSLIAPARSVLIQQRFEVISSRSPAGLRGNALVPLKMP
jgi:hypothetical protein